MNKETYNKAEALAERSKTCIFGSLDECGSPMMKAFMKTRAIGLKEFWFCSNTSSKRVTQIQKNPNAALYFYDENSFEGLMLSGKAEISCDDAKRQEFWSDGMKIYYPLGACDPDYVLVKFTAVKGNFYSGLKNVNFDIE